MKITAIILAQLSGMFVALVAAHVACVYGDPAKELMPGSIAMCFAFALVLALAARAQLSDEPMHAMRLEPDVSLKITYPPGAEDKVIAELRRVLQETSAEIAAEIAKRKTA